jgi:CNT family concentrative nucleoside transporter
MIAIGGLCIFVALAWLLGRRKGPMNLRVLAWGLGLQLLFGFLVFKTPFGGEGLVLVNKAVNALVAAAIAGPKFLVGALADVQATSQAGLGFILLFQGLLSIIVFAALMQVLYHIGLMNWVVRLFARLFTRLMRISGAEALAASANIFLGNESILAVRPFLARMSASELCVLMTACMATVSANMLGTYVAMLGSVFPGIAGHIASASLISAPAALLAAKLAWPETETPETLGLNPSPYVEKSSGLVAAIMSGAEAGGKLLVGIALLLVAAVGLLGIADLLISELGGGINTLLGREDPWSLSWLFGLLFRPAAWLMGVPWEEAPLVGQLLGMRVVTTELGAYSQLATLLGNHAVSPRSAVIAAYALCGFAHIPAVGITAGGIAALAPERREALASIAARAFMAATLACLMTGCIAGLFAEDTALLLQQ